jgi:septum formation protein
MSHPRVVLASGSPRRRQLLELVGIRHAVQPADVDETRHPGEDPVHYAARVAADKARTVAAREPDAVVIAADTIVVVDGDVLGKPADAAHAAAMLGRLSGRTHLVHTAHALVWRGQSVGAVETVVVAFRTLTAHDITAYIATGEPMDKAGAYGIQGFGATIVDRVDGDFFSVMGLGLRRVVALLDSVGLAYDFRDGVTAA